MSVKILVNGVAGAGKTDLLRSFGEEIFVVSRDAKEFSLPLPHVLIAEYTNMTVLIDLITEKIHAYEERFGKLPEVVAIDSVSQITMDVIDTASKTPNVYGSQGAEISREMGMLVKFLHEDLELSGISLLLLNHVIPESDEGKLTGSYAQFGQGKFLQKGGFYASTNEAITVVNEKGHRVVYTRGVDKQARTMCNEVPDKMWVANTVHPEKSKKLLEGEQYFSLKDHFNLLVSQQANNKKWSF